MDWKKHRQRQARRSGEPTKKIVVSMRDIEPGPTPDPVDVVEHEMDERARYLYATCPVCGSDPGVLCESDQEVDVMVDEPDGSLRKGGGTHGGRIAAAPKSWRINEYRCKRGHVTATRDLHEGTTPFMIGCKTDGCSEAAYSSFYRVSGRLLPSHEFFRPTPAQTAAMDAQYGGYADHVAKGGLCLRKIGDVDPVE